MLMHHFEHLYPKMNMNPPPETAFYWRGCNWSFKLNFKHKHAERTHTHISPSPSLHIFSRSEISTTMSQSSTPVWLFLVLSFWNIWLIYSRSECAPFPAYPEWIAAEEGSPCPGVLGRPPSSNPLLPLPDSAYSLHLRLKFSLTMGYARGRCTESLQRFSLEKERR